MKPNRAKNQTDKADRAPSNRLPQKGAHSGDGGSEAKNWPKTTASAVVDMICVGGLVFDLKKLL